MTPHIHSMTPTSSYIHRWAMGGEESGGVDSPSGGSDPLPLTDGKPSGKHYSIGIFDVFFQTVSTCIRIPLSRPYSNSPLSRPTLPMYGHVTLVDENSAKVAEPFLNITRLPRYTLKVFSRFFRRFFVSRICIYGIFNDMGSAEGRQH